MLKVIEVVATVGGWDEEEHILATFSASAENLIKAIDMALHNNARVYVDHILVDTGFWGSDYNIEYASDIMIFVHGQKIEKARRIEIIREDDKRRR